MNNHSYTTSFSSEWKAPFDRFISDPVSDLDLNPYSNPDQKVLFRFRIGSETLPCLLHFFLFQIIRSQYKKYGCLHHIHALALDRSERMQLQEDRVRTRRCGCRKRGLECWEGCKCLGCNNRHCIQSKRIRFNLKALKIND